MLEATIAYFVQLAVEITVSGRLTDRTRFEGSDMIRVMVKRILKTYGYLPDKQKKATELVLGQAHVICKDWAEIAVAA